MVGRDAVTHIVQAICIVLGVIGSIATGLVYLTWGQAMREAGITKTVAVLEERTAHNEKDISDLHKLTVDELRRITDAVNQLGKDVIQNDRPRR